MNFSKFILSMSVSSILFLGACSDDSSTDPIFTSKSSPADENIGDDSVDAKSSSSTKTRSSSSSIIADDENSDLDEGSDVSSSSSSIVADDENSDLDEDSDVSSSSSEKSDSVSSSSSEEAWGECTAGVKDNATTKGSEVTWLISPKKVGPVSNVATMASLEYTWTFEGGSPATFDGHTSKEAKTVYENSGTFNTTVTITTPSGQSQVVQCPTIEVAGAAVTGCKCTAASKTVNLAEPVSWTVSGCKSQDQNFTYIWSEPFQAVTGAVVNGTVPAKGLYKPTVRVKNADNGLMDVTCEEINVTDVNNPDYAIVDLQNAGAVKLPAGKTSVSLEVEPVSKIVFCLIARTDSPAGAVNGTVNGVKLAGSDYVAVQNVPNLTKGSMINFELDVPATCGVQ